MKSLKSLYKKAAFALLMATAVLPIASQAQDKEDQDKKEEKQEQVSGMVEARDFVFVPQTALPSSGRTRQLNNDFDLKISKDKIESYLPYFGRAYTAPIGTSEGPLSFTSTKFDYKVSEGKKGGWDVQIMPKDQQDPRQMSLSIFENGTASLTVTSNNRQPISFNGYIAAKD